MDLLEYAQKLINKGNSNQQQNAQYLQALISSNSPTKMGDKQTGNNTPLLIGGLAIFGVAAIMIGYGWGKRKKNNYE